MTRLRRMLLVGGGGAVGAMGRIVIANILPGAAAAGAGAVDAMVLGSVGLLVVNLSGSLFAGFLRGLLERAQERGRRVQGMEAFMIVGLCGGYTSYSGFLAVTAESWFSAPSFAAAIAVGTLLGAPLAALLGMRLSGGYPASPASAAPRIVR